MITKITKWGNSLAIRLPHSYLKQTNLKENESLELILENGMLILKPLDKKKFTIDELIANMSENEVLKQYENWDNWGMEEIRKDGH